MPSNNATLHLLCGKIASGKSTLTAQLGNLPNTVVVVSEDHWLSRLYPEGMTSVADYVCCSARLRDAMGSHLASLLKCGVSIVLDFLANTPVNRTWMRMIFEEAGASHQLHYLDVPDASVRLGFGRETRAGSMSLRQPTSNSISSRATL
jgi:predicted kinase